MMPEVSVVLAVYNGASTVLDAIGSIQAQTFQDWELVIIDDASTDDTPAVLESVASDRRVRLMRNTSNRGLAVSLNRAIAEARGSLIARMDADDKSTSDRLEKQVAFMREHPEVAVLGGAAELVDEAGRVVGRILLPAFHDRLIAEIYKKSPFIHPSIMARREFFTVVGGYDERLRRAQDIDLWMRAAGRHRFHNLQDVVIRYRYRPPTLRSIAYGSYVLLRSAYRDRQLLRRAGDVLRFLIGSLYRKVGVRSFMISGATF